MGRFGGSGGNAVSIARAGRSLLRIKAALFALAGLFGVLSGLALLGVTTSADAGHRQRTPVVDRGRDPGWRGVCRWHRFAGRRRYRRADPRWASPLLTFLDILPDWQAGANGLIVAGGARPGAAPGGRHMEARR